jgi:AcrR family transcriptional regulator
MPRSQPSSDVAHAVGDRRQWRGSASRRASKQALNVADFQRSRLLAAAAAVACEQGYEALTATAVVARAGTSRKTFYDLFDNRADCLLAVLEDALARITAVVAPAYTRESDWVEAMRAALVAMLALFEQEPGLGNLVLACAVGSPPAGGELRARALERLRGVVEQGRSQPRARSELSPLTAEALVGGVLAVIHARVQSNPRELTALVNPLMWMIVLPYLGPAAARKQLVRAHPAPAEMLPPVLAGEPPRGLNMRLTYRTARVLETIALEPGASNTQLSAQVGIVDQGQVSKLLSRLARLELIENRGAGQSRGGANAWHLTPSGAELEAAIRRRSALGR